jgi:hypothetical protein
MSAFQKYDKTNKEANKEVQDIITTYDDEARQARQARQAREQRLRAEADDAARIVSEHHEREKKKEGFCVTMGGRIKNIFRNKNKSNKSKSKRVNKRVKKNKRYSRKYLQRNH